MKYALCVMFAVVCGCLIVWGQVELEAADKPAQPTVAKTVTLTKPELEALVPQRMAQAMIDGTQSVREAVLQPQHWHSAIFNGVEYTIYTGPGDIASATVAAPIVKDNTE